MTQEQRKPSGGWSVDTALQHVLSLIGANDHRYEQRFLDQERAVTMAMAAAKEAVLKAENAADRRFEGVNEFRNTLSDQQRNLMPRSEVEVVVRGVHEKLGALEKQMDRFEAERRGLKGGWGLAVGVVGFVFLILSLVSLVWKSAP